jgi:hypothetical protein
VLKQTLLRNHEPYAVHTDISLFYISWFPDAELPGNEYYTVKLVIVCTSEQTQKHVDKTLRGLVSGLPGIDMQNGIIMSKPEVVVDDNLKFVDVRGLKRFSEWDELSGPSEIIGVLRS